jgi:RNA ligase (TIGR02306 family)
MTDRKLVTLETIKDISPIPNADNLEKATVRGWSVVVQKNKFKVGDKCFFFEVDSFLPLEKKYEFLHKACFKTNGDGSEGFRLRTIKLRKQLSQGLVMSLDDFEIYKESDTTWKYSNETGQKYYIDPNSDEDLSRIFNVTKYEPPIPASLSGKVKGNFPSCIPKTDQERIQNLINDTEAMKEIINHDFEVTIKLDGTSATFYHMMDGTKGVCSRNLDLKLEDDTSIYVKLAKETGILDLIPQGYAIQGEIYGNSIQSNHDKLNTINFYIFDIFYIEYQKYLTPSDRLVFFNNLLDGKHEKIKHVPILPRVHLGEDLTLDMLLEASDNCGSINNKICEGLVYKRTDGLFSFKCISNNFLLENE